MPNNHAYTLRVIASDMKGLSDHTRNLLILAAAEIDRLSNPEATDHRYTEALHAVLMPYTPDALHRLPFEELVKEIPMILESTVVEERDAFKGFLAKLHEEHESQHHYYGEALRRWNGLTSRV